MPINRLLSTNLSTLSIPMLDIVGMGTMIVVTFFAFNLYPVDDQRRWAILGLMAMVVALQSWPCGDETSTSFQPRIAHLRMVLILLISLLMVWLNVHFTAVVILYFVLSGQALFLFPNRVGYLWILILGGTTTLIMIWGLWPHWSSALLNGLGATCGYFFVGAAANAQRRAELAGAESKRLLGELQDAHAQLQEYATRAEELAVIEERNRMAREMHDTLGHRLTVAAVQLEGAQRLIPRDPAKATKMVGTVHQQVVEGLDELRQTVATLRTPVEDDLPLRTTLSRLVANFTEASDIDVMLSLPDDIPVLDGSARQAIYRAAQESLTNIQRHAEASHVMMKLALVEDMAVADGMVDRIILWVEDDGVGIVDLRQQQGFGLQGLAERAQMLGGHFSVSKGNLLRGTRLEFSLPLSIPHQSQAMTVLEAADD